MPFDDALLALTSYPDRTSTAEIDEAVQLAARLTRRLSAVATQVKFPLTNHRLADYLIGISNKAEEEEARSLAACKAALKDFTEAASVAGLFEEAFLDACQFYDVADRLARRGRTYDVAIVLNSGAAYEQHEVAQSFIFTSGRPTIVYRTGSKPKRQGALGLVTIAWDGGRCAARAMADALPLLSDAAEVRLVTFLNEKPEAQSGAGQAALRHLRVHGIKAGVEEVDTGGEPIGRCLDAYIDKAAPDLLVMGAYGHSRLREFMLGGATAHVLEAPRAPLFLSH